MVRILKSTLRSGILLGGNKNPDGQTEILKGMVRSVVYYQDLIRRRHQDPEGHFVIVGFACRRTGILLGVVRSVVPYQDPIRHGHQDPDGHSVSVYTEQTWDKHVIRNVVLGIRNPVGENRNPDVRPYMDTTISVLQSCKSYFRWCGYNRISGCWEKENLVVCCAFIFITECWV
ncbi:hypothetical protein ACLOJK_037200 [Asimina triloba]